MQIAEDAMRNQCLVEGLSVSLPPPPLAHTHILAPPRDRPAAPHTQRRVAWLWALCTATTPLGG
eukprot:5143244-Prymnesium_polylepis.1